MPRARALSWALWWGDLIFRLFWIFALFIWRVFIALGVTLWGFAQSLWRNRLISAILLVMFAVGVPMQLFQEEIMSTVVDLPYECGVYPSAEITSSVLVTVFRIPWEFVAPRWNDAVLLVYDAGLGLFSGEIRTLVRTHQIANTKQGVTSVLQHVFLIDDLSKIGDSISFIMNEIGTYFVAIGTVFVEFWEYLILVFNSWFISVDLFGLSCSLCSADTVPVCSLREPFISGQDDFDCDDCHEIQADFYGFIGSLLDAITANFIDALSGTTSFRRIFRAVGCILRSPWMYPIQIIQGLIEGCFSIDDVFDLSSRDALLSRWFMAGDGMVIPPGLFWPHCTTTDSQICCGKPSSCSSPLSDNYNGEDLPIGMVPCWAEFFLAVSGNAIEDFIELILAFFAPLILAVIKTVDRTIFCFGQQEAQDCAGNYPVLSLTGPGVCFYSNNDDFVPDGGIFECGDIVFQCLATNTSTEAPLLEPIIDYIEYMLVFLPRFTLDFVVCPFADLARCMTEHLLPIPPAISLQRIQSFLNCLSSNPFFAPLAEAGKVIVDWILQFIRWFDGIRGAFECISNCRFFCEHTFGEFFECFSGPIEEWGWNCGGKGCEDCEECREEEGDDEEEQEEDCEDCHCPNPVDCGGDEPLAYNPRSAFHKTLKEDPHALRGKHRVAQDEFSADEMRMWREGVIDVIGIDTKSFCGTLLANNPPRRAATLGFGDYTVWKICLGMYAQRYTTAKQCYGFDKNISEANFDGKSSPLLDSAKMHTWCTLPQSNYTRPHNKTHIIPPRIVSQFNTTRFFFQKKFGVRNNDTSTSFWRNVSPFLYNATQAIKKTPAWHRFDEFFTDYKDKLRTYANQGHTADEAKDLALDESYVAFSNDILAMYRTGKWRNETSYDDRNGMLQAHQYVGVDNKVYSDTNMERLKSLPTKLWRDMARIGVVEPADDDPAAEVSPYKFTQRLNFTAESKATFDTINRATGLEYRPWFQGLTGFVRAARTRDTKMMLAIVRGKKRYIASQDRFVRPQYFEKMAQSAHHSVTSTGQSTPTWAEFRSGTTDYNPRVQRTYRPFPFILVQDDPDPDLQGPTLFSLVGDMWAQKRQEYARRRISNMVRKGLDPEKELEKGVLHNPGPLNPNQFLLDFLGLFTADLFNDFVEGVVEKFDAFDLRTFMLSNVTDTLEQYFSCQVPENFDGTSLYSPFCIMLVREDIFALFTPVTQTMGQFPPQIPWPDELIVGNCTSVYTGNPNLFEFELSNNCDLSNGVVSDSGACSTIDSCVGGLDLVVKNQDPFQRIIRYTLDQTGGEAATCAVESFIMQTLVCADVESINVVDTGDDCVISGFVEAETDMPGCGINATRRWLTINLTFPLSARCVFDITYDERVRFTASDRTSYINAPTANDTACSTCETRLPVLECIDPAADPVDVNPNLRPFCGTSDCDYCNRTYQSCAAVGFESWLDTLFYFLGVLPLVGDEILFGGFPAKGIETWIGPTVLFGALLSMGFSVTACCITLPRAVITTQLAHVITWSLFIFFGDVIEWPLILFFVALYAQTRRPPWWELLVLTVVFAVSPGIPIGMRLLLTVLAFSATVPELKTILLPVYIIIYTIFAIYILTLIFESPMLSDGVPITQSLHDLVLSLDDHLFLSFYDWTPLANKIGEYIYTGDISNVPRVDTFCFWWSWANLALLMLVILFFGWFLILAWRVFIWPPLLALFGLIVTFIYSWRGYRLIRTRMRTYENQDRSEDNENAIENIENEVESMGDRVKNNVSRALARLVGERPGASAPTPVEERTRRRRRARTTIPAKDIPTLERRRRGNALPTLERGRGRDQPVPSSFVMRPDESHPAFRARVAREMEEARLAREARKKKSKAKKDDYGVLKLRSSTDMDVASDDDDDNNTKDSGTDTFDDTAHVVQDPPGPAAATRARRRSTRRRRPPTPPPSSSSSSSSDEEGPVLLSLDGVDPSQIRI